MSFFSAALNPPVIALRQRVLRIASAVALVMTLCITPMGFAMQEAGTAEGESAALAESSPEDEKAAEEAVKQKIAQRRQFYFNALFEELDNMVPGDFEDGSPQKAELEKAVTAFLDRDIQTLNDILDEQAAFDPDFPPRHLMLASMSYRVRDAKQGRQLLEKAAVASPRYPGTYAAFARLALNEGRVTDAMALLDKCARMVREGKVSDKVKDHFGKQYIAGMLQVAIAQKRYQDAREFLDRQIKQQPDNPKNQLLGAEIEFKAGDLTKSQSYLEKLKEMVPKARPYESVFASWFRQKGNNEEAGKWIEGAAEKYPKDAAAQLDYANWLLGKGRLVEVQPVIAAVEGISGESTATAYLKAQLAFADDNMSEAEKILEKIVADTKGKNLEAINLYALSLAESGDPKKQEQAQKIAQQNLGRARRSPVAQASLAYILLKRGIVEQAQRLLVPVARSKRVSSEVAYFFGYLLNELGNKDAARQALQSALQNDGLFLYRKKCQQMLDQIGGPVKADLPEPAATASP